MIYMSDSEVQSISPDPLLANIQHYVMGVCLFFKEYQKKASEINQVD